MVSSLCSDTGKEVEFYFLLKVNLADRRGGISCLLTLCKHILVRCPKSGHICIFTDAGGLKSFYFLSHVVGYSSLLSENDVNAIDIPGTPPPMPPKKHPHEIDNPMFSSEVHLL